MDFHEICSTSLITAERFQKMRLTFHRHRIPALTGIPGGHQSRGHTFATHKKTRREMRVVDCYEQYERECAKIREENDRLLGEFAQWLSEKGLSSKTIDKHVFNVDFYVNHFLLYDSAKDPAVGIEAIDSFLGYWFIKKAMWASKAQIRGNATSIKKFYQFMLEEGCVSPDDYNILRETIKEQMPEWLATMDRYDDPDIEDMEEVWDL